MPEKRWKAQERRVARLLNATRNHNTGRQGPDVENDVVACQVKDRQDFPLWLLEAVRQARSDAPPGKIPLVALTTPSDRDMLIVMHIRDYRAWYVGRVEKQEETNAKNQG